MSELSYRIFVTPRRGVTFTDVIPVFTKYIFEMQEIFLFCFSLSTLKYENNSITVDWTSISQLMRNLPETVEIVLRKPVVDNNMDGQFKYSPFFVAAAQESERTLLNACSSKS